MSIRSRRAARIARQAALRDEQPEQDAAGWAVPEMVLPSIERRLRGEGTPYLEAPTEAPVEPVTPPAPKRRRTPKKREA